MPNPKTDSGARYDADLQTQIAAKGNKDKKKEEKDGSDREEKQ